MSSSSSFPGIGVYLWGGPVTSRGFRELLGKSEQPLDCSLKSVIGDVPGKWPGNFLGSSGKSRETLQSLRKSDSLPSIYKKCLHLNATIPRS